ncbi:MAG: hypothetical protein PVJ61_01530 [Dehalococcoidia bacterium]|jgi:hypothetical protein
MKATLKKITVLSLALLLSLGAVALVACGGMSQDEIDDIIAGATNARYDSFAFDMDVPVVAEARGGTNPGQSVIAMSGNGVTDIANEAMRLSVDLSVEVDGEIEQEATAHLYVVDGWVYTGFEVPEFGEQWQKLEITDAIWQKQDMAAQNVALLTTAFEVNYKGTETLDGVECYLFEIDPDMEVLAPLLAQEATGLDVAGISILDIGALYDKLTVKQWLSKDSFHLIKTEIALFMELTPGDVGATSEDFDEATLDMSMIMRFYDYNQSFTIELPAAALDAEDITGGFTTEQTAPQE